VQIEGVFTRCMVRSLKCYHLSNPGDGGERVVRVRSVPRRAQELIEEEAFTPLYGHLTCVRTTTMRPTLGFEMTIREQTRSLPNAMNTKRRCVVGRPFLSPSISQSLTLVLQDAVHSLPLE
jgi:hypothetical protein